MVRDTQRTQLRYDRGYVCHPRVHVPVEPLWPNAQTFLVGTTPRSSPSDIQISQQAPRISSAELPEVIPALKSSAMLKI